MGEERTVQTLALCSQHLPRYLLLGLCCPLRAGSGTAHVPSGSSPGVCLLPQDLLSQGCHLYANHLWGPQPTHSRGSMKNLHFLSLKPALWVPGE